MRQIWTLLSCMEPQSERFGTLRNPWIYNRAIFRTLAYLEPDASTKACRTCKIIMHIYGPDIVRSLFKHFQGYLGVLRHTHVHSFKVERGGLAYHI